MPQKCWTLWDKVRILVGESNWCVCNLGFCEGCILQMTLGVCNYDMVVYILGLWPSGK
jgi:hypothetical protein